jgi:hypothetical protein
MGCAEIARYLSRTGCSSPRRSASIATCWPSSRDEGHLK